VSVCYFVRYEIENSEEFESEEAMNRAFASRERAEAREDFKRFMTFEGTVTHQAMKAEEVWRSPWLDGHEEQA
jgi:hypothetical protein